MNIQPAVCVIEHQRLWLVCGGGKSRGDKEDDVRGLFTPGSIGFSHYGDTHPPEFKTLGVLAWCFLASVTWAAVLSNTPASKRDGRTALHWAAWSGQLEMLDVLLLAGADINQGTKDKWTALHWAAFNGHKSAILALVAAGANVDSQTESGGTALYYASLNGHEEVVKALLNTNAKVNIQAKDGSTAIHWASWYGYKSIVEMFLSADADINLQTENRWTPLHWAAEAGSLTVAKTLLDAGIKSDLLTKDGRTAALNYCKGFLLDLSSVIERIMLTVSHKYSIATRIRLGIAKSYPTP
ncbi:hypothetical protein EMCRGX_G034962 [Ephydatia muelleri]